MSGFTKLWSEILTSSIWNENDQTRIVWITILVLKDEEGFVKASIGGLAHQAHVSLESCVKAIQILLEPDPDSRTKDKEGRRLIEVDGGFKVVNSGKYRSKNGPNGRRDYLRNYMKSYRKKHRVNSEKHFETIRKQFVNTNSEITEVNGKHLGNGGKHSVNICKLPLTEAEADIKKEQESPSDLPLPHFSLEPTVPKKKKEVPKERSRQPSSYDEFKSYCASKGISDSDTLGLYSGWEANGWMRGKLPIQKWKAAVVNWQTHGYLASQQKKS